MASRPPIAPTDPPGEPCTPEAPFCPEPKAWPDPASPEFTPPPPDYCVPDEAPSEAPAVD